MFSKFKSIDQFRNAVSNYNRSYNVIYDEATGENVIDRYKEKETLRFHGSVKCHGTNVSMSLSPDNVLELSSRTGLLDDGKKVNRLFGFMEFGLYNEEVIKQLINDIKTYLNIDKDKEVVLYGEWAGGSIQSGVGISGMDKFLYLFDFKVVNVVGEDTFKQNEYFNANLWFDALDTKLVEQLNEKAIWVNEQIGSYDIDIDMGEPEASGEAMQKLTDEVEAECPIAKHFGKENGIGEGIVWTCKINGNYLSFKEKGPKHSTTKVKTRTSVSPEVLESQNEFVEYAVTENRMIQGIQAIYGSLDEAKDKDQRIGQYINWVKGDIIKEESDVLVENKLDFGKLSSKIQSKANKFLMLLFEKNNE